MRSIKMLGLAALAALMAMAFINASLAMAEDTLLCKTEENPCGKANVVAHVHETSVTDALLLNSLGNVKCAVLFLGDTSEFSDESAENIEGNFTYSSCFRKKIFGGEESCTVKEINGPVSISVLKEGHETGKVTGEGEVELTCGTSINCVYNGEGLVGTAKGPLLSTQKNGEVTITNAVTHKVKGSLCPEEGKLDINTTPLEATYITGALHYCVESLHNTNGYYEDSQCKNKVKEGPYDLVHAPAGYNVGAGLCLRVLFGLWLGRGSNGECINDTSLRGGHYEEVTIAAVQ